MPIDKKKQGQANRDWGKQAEQIAADFLISEGYVIRERNWRCGNHIEIDIIAQEGTTIAFVEVKARKGDCQMPDESVNLKKQKNMIKGGDIYLRGLNRFYYYRLDIITITGTSDNYTLEHLKDAFLPPLT